MQEASIGVKTKQHQFRRHTEQASPSTSFHLSPTLRGRWWQQQKYIEKGDIEVLVDVKVETNKSVEVKWRPATATWNIRVSLRPRPLAGCCPLRFPSVFRIDDITRNLKSKFDEINPNLNLNLEQFYLDGFQVGVLRFPGRHNSTHDHCIIMIIMVFSQPS